jgi:hypothetical protein
MKRPIDKNDILEALTVLVIVLIMTIIAISILR